ncbi:MAG: hypothetical protein AAGI38_21030, partial [Bacteroidota bacterium]
IIKQSESLVLAQIEGYTKKGEVKVSVLKNLCGKRLPKKIKLSYFYLLDLCSISGGHGVEFEFGDADSLYLFIKKNKGYRISTPTSGYAKIKEGKVYATYRHSYHMALVPQKLYEKSMTAIFNNYHKLEYDTLWVKEYINNQVKNSVAGFEGDEIDEFFKQHVALEMAYHTGTKIELERITPFLSSDNPHAQISGIRAIWENPEPDALEMIVNFIQDSTKEGFPRVIGMQYLDFQDAREYKTRLEEILKTMSDTPSGFSGNLMDPRVCTRFPRSTRYALEDLLEKWE